MWRFRWWRDARPHTKRTRRERETVKQLWNTIVIKITIIHVQCVKNNFKQPFQVLWGLSRSLLIRKPVVSTQTPFSQTTQPWLISVTSSIYEFWHEHERHFEHVLCFLSQVHETFYTSTETTCIDRETILYRNDRCLGHGHSSIQKVIDRNQRNDRLICAVWNALTSFYRIVTAN